MRTIGFVALLITLFASLFRFYGANLDNNVLAIALMILLVILFSDLKEFNFWGLWGKKKEEEKIKKLAGKTTISQKKSSKISETKLRQIRQETVIELDESGKGNFLALAFEIERLLQIVGKLILGQENHDMENIGKTLNEKGFLTEDGVEQLNSIRWLKEILINGREDEINESTLVAGTQLAYNYYRDLKKWIDDLR